MFCREYSIDTCKTAILSFAAAQLFLKKIYFVDCDCTIHKVYLFKKELNSSKGKYGRGFS